MTVSIIIPHYNQPALLARCLQSVPRRADVQVVVVDDGSSAECAAELMRLKAEWPEVVWLEQTNAGAGAARNLGLQHATGQYVVFADSDDEFSDSFSALLDDQASTSADIVFFNARCLSDAPSRPSFKTAHLNWTMQLPERQRQFRLRYQFTEPWCKLIRRQLLIDNNITFEPTRIQNDVMFSISAGHFARTVATDPRVAYVVHDREGSVAKQQKVERLVEQTGVQARQNRFFREHGVPIFSYKVLRPMILLALNGQFDGSRLCYAELQKAGMTRGQILLRLLAYPFALLSYVELKRRWRKYVIH